MSERTLLPVKPEKPEPIPDDIRSWFEAQMHVNSLPYLLAMTDEGVIWGHLTNDKLVTAEGFRHHNTVIVPFLYSKIFQEARIFGPSGEIYVWRIDDNQWLVRRIFDQAYSPEEYYEEAYFIWGEAIETQSALPAGFSLMRDGAQELLHVMPHISSPAASLLIRHYLQDDETGFTRIHLSRLVDIRERTL